MVDMRRTPTGKRMEAVAPSTLSPITDWAKTSQKPGDRLLGRRIGDRRGRGENSPEDQLWRSSPGLSSLCLKKGKEVWDGGSLGTSGHTWGHISLTLHSGRSGSRPPF